MKKVVIGISGGVDSAVAAHILIKRGYEVHGAYLDIFSGSEREDAIKSADELGINLKIIPAKEEIYKKVAMPFREHCVSGRMLNPCVECNPSVKLPLLLAYADSINAEFIATGHYCTNDFYNIGMGRKDFDQSYMFCRTPENLLKRLLLPLGGMNKQRVREIALKNGISVSKKPDSRDGCFFGNKTCAEWIEATGDFDDKAFAELNGEIILETKGIHNFTAGQKFMENENKRLYVKKIIDDRLILSDWDGLFTDTVKINSLMRFNGLPETPFRAQVRIRHTRRETPDCTVAISGDTAQILADTPFRAPCAGQACAVYVDGKLVLSGIVL